MIYIVLIGVVVIAGALAALLLSGEGKNYGHHGNDRHLPGGGLML